MGSKIRNIKPNEIKIIGQWIEKNGKVEKDENCLRIEYLIDNCLEKFLKVMMGGKNYLKIKTIADFGN